ncbi:bacterial peptide chain release factor 1 (bRF-1) [Desulfurobacterium pacificum]|uniref:Peptide chain release factor 1 n=1 Tax=Desulfurobacterium pacificum TaxID=240166 RepID=A0ABY1NNB9_9BACT|nr:peptide chain release factor 1 [Desulfurobacterium pacificum]SMP14159.1 bacterial peptide chain release factor 1 (bRF-1) [Desulfurobacterium pacificum]
MERGIEQRLEKIAEKFKEIEENLGKPEIIADQKKFQTLAKEHSELQPIYETYMEYKKAKKGIEEAIEIIESGDEELAELAKEEKKELEEKVEKLENKLKKLLIPKDPNDEKNVILEIRAGAGGEEAALFAQDLFRMYSRYAEKKGWKVEILSLNETGLGGIKEVIAMISGKGAYSRLKYESGVHRVQRIPVTESGGRIHTSTATVAVLPEAEEVDIKIDEKDLKIDTYRSSGAGGQHVNTTDSAVRITHIPTGIVVTCSNERSQIQNRIKAMKILRARLKELYEKEQKEKLDSARRSQVGTGDRSEKIRTYNFPEGRVTDHRIKLTLYNLQEFLDGEIDEMVDALIAADQEKKVEALAKESL